MNKNIILLEKLYENKNIAYIKKERAHSAWDYDNEFLDNMDSPYSMDYNTNLFDEYNREKINYDIFYKLYIEKQKMIINYIKSELPIDCINYINTFI